MQRNPDPQATLGVVLAYAVFAGLWILLSDSAVDALFTDPDQIVRVSMIKGWLFVAVTTVLLYALVRRVQLRQDAAARREWHLQAERLRAIGLYEAIAETSDDLIYAKDREGRYLLFNPAASRVVGKPPGDVVGRDDRYIFPTDQADLIKALDRGVMQSGRSSTHEEVLDTAGGRRTYLTTKGPLRGADGEIVGVFGISRDITERNRAEIEKLRLDAELDATLRAIPDLLFEVDEDGRYLAVHAANSKMLVAPSSTLIGKCLADLLPEAAAAVCKEAIRAASANGADYGRTYHLVLDGVERYFELSVARKVLPTGAPASYVAIARDITERRCSEVELQARNAELERFNRVAVGREIDMLELKRQVNALSRELGRDPPFRLPADAVAGAPPPP